MNLRHVEGACFRICLNCGKPCDIAPEPIKCSFCGDDKYTEGVDQNEVHACKKCCEGIGMSGEPQKTEGWEEEFRKRFKQKDGVEWSYIPNDQIINFISSLLAEKDKDLKSRISMLRQYLNERSSKELITNEEIEEFLIK